ncbi:carbohydrate ABC transporter permease [Ornithinibacillus halophilus]|uniref:Carbohydrate ABC transporter membrane protein 1, CUT1 family n=1 Tax=Ornithinibacillus halophilus TaxID=930117 RepID=A0A1M5GTC7_9BACI|nr:sugar ABC transporter permease [Ornithinibacillus halophilus]SHG06887.1 carbohydrate ABC transporter membrane protein 1, CUT1 family [Ornithinibacillus halophilus]
MTNKTSTSNKQTKEQKVSLFQKIRGNHKHQQYLFVYICLLLPIIFFLGIRILPTLFTFNVGFRDWNLLSSGPHPFVGLENYVALIKDEVFIKSVVNTIVYIVFGVFGQLLFGIIVALLLHKINRFVGFFRVIYFIPYVTSIVAISWVFQWILMGNGVINDLLINLGLPPQPFLNSPDQAIYVIIGAMIWQAIGFQMVLFLAGLENIPQMLYEAADIDGATPWQKFWHVTVPLLNPTIVFSAVIGTINFIQVSFTQVMNMSVDGSGGPLNSTITVVVYIYQLAFRQFDLGLASAATVLLFLFILALTLFQMKVLTRKFDY